MPAYRELETRVGKLLKDHIFGAKVPLFHTRALNVTVIVMDARSRMNPPSPRRRNCSSAHFSQLRFVCTSRAGIGIRVVSMLICKKKRVTSSGHHDTRSMIRISRKYPHSAQHPRIEGKDKAASRAKLHKSPPRQRKPEGS